ncbi:MAG: PAS domain S-box protein [Deltaproteobacteria bacterium]|nr:PAS domain S-box protein [Deltaproteobacteria bacterium]
MVDCRAPVGSNDNQLGADGFGAIATVLAIASNPMLVIDELGEIRLANPPAERLFGGALDGVPFASVVPAERLGRRRDGTEFPIARRLEPLRVADRTLTLAAVTDLTLAAADHQLHLVIEAAPDAIVVVDAARTIRMVNRKAEDLFGYARGELTGRPLELLVPERLRTRHAELVAGYTATARPMGLARDLYGRRRDGSEMPLEIGLSPMPAAEGTLMLAAIVDITERKAIEDELRRSNAELEQFAYIASHDLQEPLRMVASFTELLAQRYQSKLDERADKYIFFAVDGAKRMQQLVADLLAYSRVGSQGRPLAPVPAGVIVREVVQVLGATIRATGATIDVGALPTVLADDGQLRQLFQNLIGNAIKFRGLAAPVVTIRAALRDDRWQFDVADNGIGIDAQYEDRIFQMFQRLHERGKYDGSGIGLTIAKRILERHGGRIWFTSELGVGTTFHFTLHPVANPS